MSLFLVLATVIFTIVAALALGVAASYAAVNGILFLFGHHSAQNVQPARKPTALIQSHASGD